MDRPEPTEFELHAAAVAWGNLDGARALIETKDLVGAARALDNAEAWIDFAQVEAAADLAAATAALRRIVSERRTRTWHERLLAEDS